MRCFLVLLVFLFAASSEAQSRRALIAKRLSPAPAAATEITPELGWWKFVSDTTDSVGGFTGTLVGNAAVSSGKLNLDGTGDYMTADSVDQTHLNPAATTWSCWINATSLTPGYSAILIRGNADPHYAQIFIKSSGKLAIYISTAGVTEVSYDGTGSTTLSTATQYFLAFTYSAADGLRGYVNASSDATVAATGNALLTFSATFSVGTDLINSGRDFAGTVDDVRIYNRVLSGAEITTLYTNGPQ